MVTSTHQTKFVLSASDKTKVAVKSATANFEKLDGVVSKLATGFVGLAGLGGIGLLIKSQADGAKQALAYSDALGVNIEQLTAWQFAAQSVGIESDKMADIMKDVTEKIGDAYRNKGGEAKQALDGLNLSIKDMAQLSPDQQLLKIADALNKVQTQGEKVQIMEALGNDATLLLPLLKDNAKELKRLMKISDQTGNSLNRVDAEKLQKSALAMQQLNGAMNGLGNTIAVELSGPLTHVINQLSIGIPVAFGLMKDAFTTSSREELSNATKRLRGLIDEREKYQAKLKKYADQENDLDATGVIQKKQVAERINRINQQLEAQREIVKTLQDQLNKAPVIEITGGGGGGGGGGSDTEKANIQAKLERLRTSLLSEEDAINESYIKRQAIIDSAEMLQVGTDEERRALSLQLETQHEEALTAITEREARKRTQIEQASQNQINGMKQNALGLAVGLLQTLGSENKNFARAAIILGKSIAIARINKDAAVAHMGAETLWSLGPAAPAAIAAAHAEIESVRALSIGLTAATGIAQLAAINKGGSGGGDAGTTNQASTDNSTTPVPITPVPASQNSQIIIKVEGNLYDSDGFRQVLVETLQQADSNDEIRIINNG